ncbi:P1 family peptidase [Phaeovulum vinaykumarii]|uniref:D-aminopeptidase n=1 Tax=Phaeovulum vinaykumarii TaxID=407234 RepID=A0A1N7MMI0_9RHOB|nr:P1 family peptidase [Phaeovulum vinaykumarii]SIS87287.1 D-aminopeptidase [Phaeovulum vinaykumarii]SOC13216.1 D-aminopeptidase [Phaeovulum vinaykumarii]
MQPGARNLITDIEGLRVGNAADERLRSGTTVLVADRPVMAAVQVMGGAPGTRETDLLAPDRLVSAVDALVLSGGSAFGLEAAGGVMDGLRAMGRGFAVGPVRVPIVPAAILFDLTNGGDKNWTTNPYPALGRAALANAAPAFEIGTAGAGTGAITANLKGGLGSASAVLDSGLTLGALVAVNSLGAVTVGESPHFWAAPWEMEAEFGGLGPAPDLSGIAAAEPMPLKRLREATTIAIVATDAKLDQGQLQRLAVAAHDGMARAIVPSHTPFDGDLVFSVSTGARPLCDPLADPFVLGHAAAACLARAIARAVHAARPQPGDMSPAYPAYHRAALAARGLRA